MKTRILFFLLLSVLGFSELSAQGVSISAEKDLVCVGESNKLSAFSPFIFAGFLWEVSDGAVCSPCVGEDIEVIASQNGPVTVTVRAVFGGALLGIRSTTYWVGPPSDPEITYSNAPDCLPKDHSTTFFVEVANGTDRSTDYLWRFPSCTGSTDPNSPDRECWYAYDANPSINKQMLVHTGYNSGQVSVWASNKCGSSSTSIEVELCEDEPTGNTGTGGTKPRPGSGGTGPHIPFIGQDPGTIANYPNPFSTIINLKGVNTGVSTAPLVCQLFNNVGQLIYSEEITEKNSWKTQIPTADFETGIYYLEVRQDGVLLHSDKLIK